MYHDPTLTREIIQDVGGELCQSICDQVYWYVGNNDPQTGYVLCCDVNELKNNLKETINRTNYFNDKRVVSSLTAVNINYRNVPLGDGGGELVSNIDLLIQIRRWMFEDGYGALGQESGAEEISADSTFV